MKDSQDCVDDVLVGSRQLTNVALLMHEFMTNSAKYGALSHPTGTIEFRTELDGDEVNLAWSEVGGPAVLPPEGVPGFGTRLESMIKESLRATLTKDWNADGLVVRLSVLVQSLSD